MHSAARPYFTTGIALAGAGVIAVAPLAVPPDTQVPNPAVQLAATPFDAYVETFGKAVANAQALLDEALASPSIPVPTLVEILTGVLADPQATFQDLVAAVQQLGTTLPVIGSLHVSAGAVLGASRATVVVGAVVGLVSGLVSPAISGAGATGVAVQGLIDAVRAGVPAGILNAVIGGPALIADGVLNGGFGPNLAPNLPFSVLAGGILSPAGDSIPPIITPGPIAAAIELAQVVRALLTPPTTLTPLTSTSTTNERLVTLDVVPDAGEVTNLNQGGEQPSGARILQAPAQESGGGGQTAAVNDPKPRANAADNEEAQDGTENGTSLVRDPLSFAPETGTEPGTSSHRSNPVGNTIKAVVGGVTSAVKGLTGGNRSTAGTGNETSSGTESGSTN